MKKIKRLVCAALACLSIFSFSSCALVNRFHKHSWQNYVVKKPTCTEKGLIEKLCEDCGEKEYEDLMPSGHNYQNGACTVCGAFGYAENQIEPLPMPENANNTAAWSFEKIYEAAQTGGNTDSYNGFINSLEYGNLDNIYIDPLGLLHITANVITYENKELLIPLVLTISKVSPVNNKTSKFGNVYSVEVQNGQLVLTYSDGLQATAGKITNAPVTITKFGINPNNELVIYYSDYTIAFAGKVPEGLVAETQASFIYRQKNSGYAICGTLKTNENILKVPISHQGKAITTIDADTFKNVIGENISIVIPESITSVDMYAFRGLTSSATLFFEGKQSNYNSAIYNTSARTYFKGQWSYVNGVPTPNN